MKEILRIVIWLILLTGLVLCVTSTCGVEEAHAQDGPQTLCDNQCPSWIPIVLLLITLGLLVVCVLKERGK